MATATADRPQTIPTRDPDAAKAKEGSASQDVLKMRFPIPAAIRFDGQEYVLAPELQTIADDLISTHDLAANDARVGYLWKAKGGQTNGRNTLGKTQKPSGLLAFFAHQYDFIIWLAADHHATMEATKERVEASLYHELRHIDTDPETDELVLVGHEFAGFLDELDLFRDVDDQIAGLITHAQQLPLDLDAAGRTVRSQS